MDRAAGQGNGEGDHGADSGFEALLARAVRRIEQEGPAALELLAARHPEHADDLRRHLGALDRVGLLAPPARLGRFSLLGPLGRGGMGVVHLAHDDEHDRLVALKTLPGRVLASERSAERFRREVAAVAALQHPSVVPIVDAGEDEGVPYLALEYVPGRSLAEALEDARSVDRGTPTGEPWPPGTPGDPAWCEAVCRVMIDVADGLHHAHRRGVVHRDVKPENIVLGDDGRARLLDFGLAHVAGEPTLTTTGEFTGTPSYAAPEQVSTDSGPVDARTDVHGLGATLYELLTLRRPFGDDNAAEVARRVLSVDPVRPSRLAPPLPRDLDVVCATALEKRPERRYPTAAAFAADLRAVLDGDPITARAPGALQRALRLVRRRPALAAAVGLGLVLAVGGPLFLWHSRARIQDAWRQEEAQRLRAEAATREATAAAGEAERAAREAQAALADLLTERARADAADDAIAGWRRTAELVDGFLHSILVRDDPLRNDADASVGELLDRAAAEAGEALASEPRLLATMGLNLGKANVNIGRYEEAIASFSAAWDVAEPLTGGEADAVRHEIRGHGTVPFLRLARWQEAERWARSAQELAAAHLPESDPRHFGHLSHLAQAVDNQGRRDEARELYRRVLTARRADPATAPEELARALTNLAATLPNTEREEQQRLMGEAVAIQATLRPTDDYDAAKILANRMWTEFYTLEPGAEDIVSLRHARDVVRGRLGSDDDFSATLSLLLGMMLERREESDPAEVETLLAEAVAELTDFDPRSPRLVMTLQMQGEVLRDHGRRAEALAAFLEAISVRRATSRPEMNPTEDLLVAQVVILLRELGQDAQAAALLDEHPGAREWIDSGRAFPP